MRVYQTIIVVGFVGFIGSVIGYLIGARSEITVANESLLSNSSETPSFAPFKIYPSDLLVPINRICLPGGNYLSDSWREEGHYGSGGGPRIAFLFFIEDATLMKRHYFLCSGTNGKMLDEMKYLGDNINVLENVNENGYLGVKFLKPGITGEVIASVSDYALGGREPDENCDSVQTIPLIHERYAPQYKVDENRDTRWVDTLSAKEFYVALQRAILENNKPEVAKMIAYPIDVYFKYPNRSEDFQVTIRSEQEFIDYYDYIITSECRQNMKEESVDELFCSWRGTMMGGFWMQNVLAPDDPAMLIDAILY